MLKLPIWNQKIFYELLSVCANGRRWLDLGCGRGTYDPMLLLVRRGIKEKMYVGVDMDMPALIACSEKQIVQADISSLPFTDRSFDLVTSNMVFEHLSHPISVLKEAHRVLVDGGVLLVHASAALHYMLLLGRMLSASLPRSWYVKLVSRYTGRNESDIYPAFYQANTVRRLRNAACAADFVVGFITYLETPTDGPKWIRNIESSVRPFIPGQFKSSLLGVFTKST